MSMQNLNRGNESFLISVRAGKLITGFAVCFKAFFGMRPSYIKIMIMEFILNGEVIKREIPTAVAINYPRQGDSIILKEKLHFIKNIVYDYDNTESIQRGVQVPHLKVKYFLSF